MARRIRDPMTLPTVYVVSLACVPERRRRMIRRLREQKIPFEIVEAHDDRSTRIDFYAPGETHPQRRRIAACLASHLDALRSFVESGAKEAVVVEDDVRPIRDLHRRFHEVRANVPDGTPLVCLSYLVWSWSGFLWAGREPSKENLCTMGSDTWGTQMYWITRDWARECLRRFVRPLTAIETDQIRTAELITRESRGLVAYPPLGIEELSGSTICPEAGDANHAEALERWCLEDYAP